MAKYKVTEGWVAVVQHMGGELSSKQCQNRWNDHLRRNKNKIKTGTWEDEEVKCDNMVM